MMLLVLKCAEERLMRMIAAAIDDSNIDEDEQKEIDEAELQVRDAARITIRLLANSRVFGNAAKSYTCPPCSFCLHCVCAQSQWRIYFHTSLIHGY